jgi:DNA-binding NarL/FixJ family response regulator
MVLCSQLAVAQALVQALGLSRARVWRTAAQALAEWQGQPPGLVILIESDQTLLIPAVQLVKRRWPQTRALLVGLPDHEGATLSSRAAGANGIVLDEEPLDDLRQAVRTVRAGGFRAPPTLIPPLLDRLIWLDGAPPAARGEPRLACLSTREHEILTHVARGETNKQIAVALHVEEQTIKNQLRRVFRKLNVRARADAVRVWAHSLS